MSERRWTASDFEYELPQELIAQVPSSVRGESRLLVIDRASNAVRHAAPSAPSARSAGVQAEPTTPGVRRTANGLGDSRFAEISGIIPRGDLVVVNSTRVRHARLLGTRPSGGPAEVLLLHPSTDDTWLAIGTPGSALRPGKRIALDHEAAIETLEALDDGIRRVRFVGTNASDAIARFGRLPLPPYINREPTADDDVRYQTVYAEREGSVAAPTAGLHFTDELLDGMRARDIAIATLDLEVGPGTFRPMDSGDVSAHPMHPEHFEISEALADAIAACRQRGGDVWAVGTTVVRALESAARDDGSVAPGEADTRLMITPGFRFRVVDHLITNFHLPRSTLLMLVCAFAGYDRTMSAYRHAVGQRYRFYSYGDAMVIV